MDVESMNDSCRPLRRGAMVTWILTIRSTHPIALCDSTGPTSWKEDSLRYECSWWNEQYVARKRPRHEIAYRLLIVGAFSFLAILTTKGGPLTFTLYIGILPG
jgi:hypothetical protein